MVFYFNRVQYDNIIKYTFIDRRAIFVYIQAGILFLKIFIFTYVLKSTVISNKSFEKFYFTIILSVYKNWILNEFNIISVWYKLKS